jgi:iron complex transport system ATP-binding protein
MGLLKSLKGRTVMATFHDIGLAKRYCSRCILIKSGSIAGDGDPDVILEPKKVSEVFDAAYSA